MLKRARSPDRPISTMPGGANLGTVEPPTKRIALSKEPDDDEIKSSNCMTAASPVKLSRKENLRKCCREILDQLTAIDISEHSRLFAEPVKASEVPGYFESIKNPMDLLTIRQRLEGDAYEDFYPSLASFAEDFILICENCLKFNHDVEEYYSQGIKFIHSVKATFQAMAASYKLSVPESIHAITLEKYPLSRNGNQTGRTSKKRKRGNDSDEDWGEEHRVVSSRSRGGRRSKKRRQYSGFISKRKRRSVVSDDEDEFDDSDEDTADSNSSEDEFSEYSD